MAFEWLTQARRNTLTYRKNGFQPRVERLEDRLTPVTSVTDLTQGITPAALVQTLIGTGVQVTNIKYTGAAVAAGKFSGGQNTVGFDQGIILSTGAANGVIGPNTGATVSTDNQTAGDSDLNTIVAPNTTFDASVLEFDFIPASGKLTFNYVFSSEEYPEFVNAGFNDVFAFYINGQNVALVPNTNTAVAIDTVNAGSNSQYFVDNYTNTQLQITMDGLTTVLKATAIVQGGQVNHMKLAIADAGDSILDSNVFIQAGSITSTIPLKPDIRVFNPARFTYNPITKTYNGYFTLLNVGQGAVAAPFYMYFLKLPLGVSLANPSGKSAAHVPFMKINKTIAPHTSVKVLVKISNPLHKPLYTFFLVRNLKFSDIPL